MVESTKCMHRLTSLVREGRAELRGLDISGFPPDVVCFVSSDDAICRGRPVCRPVFGFGAVSKKGRRQGGWDISRLPVHLSYLPRRLYHYQ
ncbi:MAG: hypothetical protein JW759_04640, partial [Candidatus Coatesbacteria bacterium]|nr:hypothetical protein [Candidatus Coatesbacteria bacterium]